MRSSYYTIFVAEGLLTYVFNLFIFSCPRDPTIVYNYEKSAIQKFSMKAFKFRRFPTSRVYVHCNVETCRRADTDSVCETGCVENGRRRRENKPYIMDKELFLSLGPVKLQQKKPGK